MESGEVTAVPVSTSSVQTVVVRAENVRHQSGAGSSEKHQHRHARCRAVYHHRVGAQPSQRPTHENETKEIGFPGIRW